MHLILISLFFCLKPRKHIRHVKWESSDRWYSIGSQIISVRITQPCVDPSNRRASLLSEARAQFWGAGHNLSEIKKQTMCARLTQELTLTRWSHTRWVTAAHPLTHNYTLQLGEWERGPGRRNNSFSVRVGWDFHFGGVPCGKHVTFLFDNYCC